MKIELYIDHPEEIEIVAAALGEIAKFHRKRNAEYERLSQPGAAVLTGSTAVAHALPGVIPGGESPAPPAPPATETEPAPRTPRRRRGADETPTPPEPEVEQPPATEKPAKGDPAKAALTTEDCRSALKACCDKHGLAVASKVLGVYGVKTVSAVEAKDMAAFIATCENWE